ncbi:MAG: T9SS type A sorting domain-containing protein [Armatimonadetes bacterium]|nr:T9SS type A sorting domain-containing protein [Armatimonadota bacterium]
MRKRTLLLSAALLTGAIPLLAQTTEPTKTTPSPETTKTIWYDSATGARHFKIEQNSTNSDGVQQKQVQRFVLRANPSTTPASVVVSDSVLMEDVLIKADDGGKHVVRLRRMVNPNAAGVEWTTDSTAMIQDVLMNADDLDVLQFNSDESAPQIMTFDISRDEAESIPSEAVPQIMTFDIGRDDESQVTTFDIGRDEGSQVTTVDIRGGEGGKGQVVVSNPAQFQILDLQDAENIRLEGGSEDLDAQIEQLMQELKARDGELKKVLEQTSTESGNVRKEIRIVRRSLDSARVLMDAARGEVAKMEACKPSCKVSVRRIAPAVKYDSAMADRMRQLLRVVDPNGATRVVAACTPVAPAAPMPPDAPIPPLPPDADILFKAFHSPQMVMLSGDSVSIVEEKNGERVVRVFELGNRDTTLVINESDQDGTHRTITLFNGPLTMMNAGEKNLRVICMKGDSMVANVDQKVIVIGPRYFQARVKKMEEVKPSQDAPAVVAKSATPAEAGGYMLHDAMPNPASGTVTVNFTLPEAGQATLQLYDANGTVVKTMANGNHTAGDHTATFDTADLSSGTYFYRLTSGDFVQSKALQVVK